MDLRARPAKEWVGARNCREDDFSSSEAGKRILSDWDGYTIICPDIKENE